MKTRYLVYLPLCKVTSDLVTLHPLNVLNSGPTGNEGARLLMCSLLIGSLALAVFGVLLLVRHFNRSQKTLRNLAEIGLFCLFVGASGAIGNVVQNETLTLLGGMMGMAIGGTIGALVVGVAGFFSQVVEKLPASSLLRLGYALTIIGCFVALTLMAILVLSQR